MQLTIFRTLWGVTTPWQQTVSELKSVGCGGIEARVPLIPEEQPPATSSGASTRAFAWYRRSSAGTNPSPR